jgi:ATP-dependent Clp protease adaptor protein ClpS
MNIFQEEQEQLTEVLEEVLDDVQSDNGRSLVVYNDDVNTFDHVIDTLMKVCQHTLEQAEQCTMLIHYKGKCVVKNGSYTKLNPMRTAICDAGIDAKIH